MDKINFSFSKKQCELLFTGISFYLDYMYGIVTFDYVKDLSDLKKVFFDSFHDSSENSSSASEFE